MRKKYIQRFQEMQDKIKMLESELNALIFASKYKDDIVVEVEHCFLGTIIYPKIFIKFITDDFELFEHYIQSVGEVKVEVRNNQYIEVWSKFDEKDHFLAEVYKIDRSGAVIKVDVDLYKKG